jgi:hypothetical protein
MAQMGNNTLENYDKVAKNTKIPPLAYFTKIVYKTALCWLGTVELRDLIIRFKLSIF